MKAKGKKGKPAFGVMLMIETTPMGKAYKKAKNKAAKRKSK